MTIAGKAGGPYPSVVVTGAQIRAARALIGMDQLELCRRAGISRTTLHSFERGVGNILLVTAEKLVRALDDAGVELTDAGQGYGVGVRLKS